MNVEELTVMIEAKQKELEELIKARDIAINEQKRRAELEKKLEVLNEMKLNCGKLKKDCGVQKMAYLEKEKEYNALKEKLVALETEVNNQKSVYESLENEAKNAILALKKEKEEYDALKQSLNLQ